MKNYSQDTPIKVSQCSNTRMSRVLVFTSWLKADLGTQLDGITFVLEVSHSLYSDMHDCRMFHVDRPFNVLNSRPFRCRAFESHKCEDC